MLGAYILGIPVLSALSGCDLTAYRGILVFLLLAGGFNAVSFTMYYILTIMRSTAAILVNYVLAAVLALVISKPFVCSYGITGAAVSYFIVVTVLCVLFGLSIGYQSWKIRKEIGKTAG